MPGPKPQVVVLAREDRDKLERITKAATSEQRRALRARIVLQAAEGVANTRIARSLDITDDTVRKWRGRFVDHGLLGLDDRPRSGRPPGFDGVLRCQVLSLACRPVPDDYHRHEWTLMSLKHALLEADLVDAISTSTIGRILREADLRPHRYQVWIHSPDPDFTRKVRDVVDLYVRRPTAGEVVLCIDEKTGMQALRRRFPGRIPSPAEVGRWEFEYRRQGTRCLTAAWNVHTGHVFGRVTKRRTKVDLLAFMDEVATHYPSETVHVVWDNLNTHHGPHWEDFNRRHGSRFRFHYTPIHASWCNQVELWFSILARRVLRRASFRDAEDLAFRVLAFIDHWNHHEAKPFRWTFTGYPVQTGLDPRTPWLRTSSPKPPRRDCEPCFVLPRATGISRSSLAVTT